MSETQQQPAQTNTQLTVLWLLILLAIGGITFLIIARLMGVGGVAPEPAVDETAILGKSFGDWQLLPLVNVAEPVSSESTKGKVVLLNFWATWCPPCRKELPELAELGQEFGSNKDFQLVTVSSGQDDFDSAEQASTRLLGKEELDIPTYFDPDRTLLRIWQEWSGDSSVPITLVLDREGKTRGFWIGANDRYIAEMRTKVKELLAK